MREIKFRGKRVDNSEWVYGYVYCGDKFGCSTDINNAVEVSILNNDYDEYEVVKETLGQFTGLKDVQGFDIYEGDIVRVYYNGYEDTTIHEVKYGIDTDYPAFDLEPVINYADSNSLQYAVTVYSVEVIGNIHELFIKEEVK